MASSYALAPPPRPPDVRRVNNVFCCVSGVLVARLRMRALSV